MLSTLIIALYEEAQEQGRLQVQDEVASDVLRVLRYGAPVSGKLTTGEAIGLELRSGNIESPEAKAIRAKALRSIENYEVFLRCLDRIGYTLQLVRAALTVHRERISSEPLGSDGNCVYIDLLGAMERCPDESKQALRLMMLGEGPRQIGDVLGTNGSAAVSQALRQVAALLEKKDGTTKSKRRRRRRSHLGH